MTEPGKNAPPPFTATAIAAPPMLRQAAADYGPPASAAQSALRAAPPRRVLTPSQLGQLQGQAALRTAGGSQ